VDENGEPLLLAEIDFTEALRRYMFEREEGETPAEARQRVTSDYDKSEELFNIIKQAQPRLAVRERVEKALKRNINWEDLKQDWNTFDAWLVKTEKEYSQTIEQFMQWFNSDDFRSKGVIYLSPQRIKDWWLQAFETDSKDKSHAL
jgi:hypothetical protein